MVKLKYFAVCPLLFYVMVLGGILALGSARQIPFNNDNEFHCSTLDKRPGLEGRTGILDTRYRWKTFRIYLEESFTSKERKIINDAMQTLREILPCVQFEISDSAPTGDYVFVKRDEAGGRCYSNSLGRRGGMQLINLGPRCRNDRVILHEFFHALGIHHEMNRSDRDKYVTIYWENMDPYLYSQFEKVTDAEFSDFGVPYNHKSIMHYSSYAGTIFGEPTMLTKAGKKIPKYTTLQDTDILKLQKMYECSNAVV